MMIRRLCAWWLLCLALLLAAPNADAAWSSIGTLGTATSTTDSTTLAITTSAAAEAGNVVFVWTAWDNQALADGASTNIDTVTDSAGNTYVKVIEETETQAGGTNDGTTIAIFYAIVSNTLASSGTITITADTQALAKSASVWEFGFAAGSTITVMGGAQASGGSNAEQGALTISSLANAEYLWIYGMGIEANAGTFTNDADYSEVTQATADTGTTGTSQRTIGAFRIFTGTTDTIDTSHTAAAARTWRQVFVAIREDLAAGGAPPGSLLRLGIGR